MSAKTYPEVTIYVVHEDRGKVSPRARCMEPRSGRWMATPSVRPSHMPAASIARRWMRLRQKRSIASSRRGARVLAYLRAAPVRDRIGQHYYPAVDAVLAQALETDGLVRLVDWQLAGPNGCWLVDLLEIER